jgi:hypothetical protein
MGNVFISWRFLFANKVKNDRLFKSYHFSGSDKIKDLEEEHKRLNESVLSLSTQFAHIQFRLQQINAAPAENRDVRYQI